MTTRLNYWFDTTNLRLKMQSELPCDKFDVVIIGGGIAGLSTLYQLLQKGINAIVLEKSDIGFRASGRANGNASLPSFFGDYSCSFDDIYSALKMNNNILRQIVHDEGMDCHMDICGELQVCATNCDKISESNIHTNIMSMDEETLRSIIPSKSFRKGIFFPASLMINSYRLLYCLTSVCELSSSRIFSNAEVKKIVSQKKSVKLTLDDSRTIECQKIIICNPGQSSKFISRDILKSKTRYGCCSKLLPLSKYWTMPLTPIHILNDDIRVRTYNQRLFIDTADISDMSDITIKIRSYFDSLFNVALEYSWSDKILSTPDNLPIIGQVDTNVYLNTAFGSHGFSFAFLGGKIISDCINSGTSDNKIFDPRRFERE